MFDCKELVDKILESDDYISILRERKSYNVKTFEEFANVIKDFDERVKKHDIETKLEINPDSETCILKWFVDSGYMNDKNRLLCVKSFENGKVTCDLAARFRVPGSTNINRLADANQLLQAIDNYMYELERNDPSEEEKEEKEYELSPEIKKVLDDLKVEGEKLINKFKGLPPLEYENLKIKIDKAELMASTEKELIVSLEFPSDMESLYIYNTDKKYNALRKAILKYYSKAVPSKNAPEFRLDMNKYKYFYSVVGKLPVKNPSDLEAKAILNYYDGKKVQFQPKESE